MEEKLKIDKTYNSARNLALIQINEVKLQNAEEGKQVMIYDRNFHFDGRSKKGIHKHF